jgi:hypothetical protein
MFYNAISVVCVLPMPRKVGYRRIFCQNFSHFSGGILRLFFTTKSVGRKYAILTGSKNRLFWTFSANPQDFSGFSLEKWDNFVKNRDGIIEKSQGFVKISRRLVKIILDLFSKKP